MDWNKVRSEVLALALMGTAWANKKWNLGIEPQFILSLAGLVGLIIAKHWHLDAKAIPAPSAPVTVSVSAGPAGEGIK